MRGGPQQPDDPDMKNLPEPSADSAFEDDADPVAVRVWDVPVRVFHWTLVALLVASIVSIKIGGNAKEWHVRCGYAILALALFRILWGFAGTHHARFTTFVRGPGAVIRYAQSILAGRHETHAGHNPLGGWMIVLMLIALVVQASLGLFSNDDIAIDGPLVHLISKELSDRITSLHHRGAWVIFALAAMHVGAVGFYLVALKENLVRPMVTGAKRLHPAHAPDDIADAPLRAVLLLALSAAAVWAIVTRW
jgi:cytochrome b